MPELTTSSLNTIGTPRSVGIMSSAMCQRIIEGRCVWDRKALNSLGLFLIWGCDLLLAFGFLLLIDAVDLRHVSMISS